MTDAPEPKPVINITVPASIVLTRREAEVWISDAWNRALRKRDEG